MKSLFAPGKIQFDDQFFNKRPYNSLVSYRQSKLANVLFSRELSRRMKGKHKDVTHWLVDISITGFTSFNFT